MLDTGRRNSILVLVGIIVGAGLLLGLVIIPSFKQTESDCSKAETFNQSSSKCVLKTSSQYVEEIEEAEKAKKEAESEAKRRNGTSCIPAEEAINYVGVTGCVFLPVEHVNRTNYGWGWLNSEIQETPTEFTVFYKNNVLSPDENAYFLGRYIEVSGTIQTYEGKAQIEITSRDSIKDIESFEEHTNRFMNTVQEIWDNRDQTIETLETRSENRKKCYDEKIKSANSKEEKDSVYQACQNPS